MVDDEEAFEVARKLSTNAGLFVGMSSGAAVAGHSGSYRIWIQELLW
jgi:cysteine synthase